MGNQNTDTIQHNVFDDPNSFSDSELYVIVNEIDEDLNGVGFTQVVRTTFIDKTILWDKDPDQFQDAKKKVETTYNRSTPPFVSSIIREVYNFDGDAVVATVTSTYTRTGENKINSQKVTVTRP